MSNNRQNNSNHLQRVTTTGSSSQSAARQNTQTRFLVEHWDQLCPLTELERQSIHQIQRSIANDRPIPANLIYHHPTHNTTVIQQQQYSQQQDQQHQSPSSTRSSSPSHSLLRITRSQPRLDLLLSASSFPPDFNHLDHNENKNNNLNQRSSDTTIKQPVPIATIEAFNDWFSIILSHIEADSESDYLNHLSILSTYTQACDTLDRAIDDCRALLREIEANWKFVDENSKSLERSCEGMLEDQKQLSRLADALEYRLSYFRKLEEAQRVLSLPGEGELVQSPEFLQMIDELDHCLDFMRSNRHFRDADLYLVRFQQCLTRSMTLIKLHCTQIIRSLGRSTHEKLLGKEDSFLSSLIQTLLYTKFEALSSELRPLTNELEKRFLSDPDEYGALLNELFTTWFGVRSQLLSGRLKNEINQMGVAHHQLPDIIKLGATGCNHMRMVCAAEWKLFKSFFSNSGDDEVFSFLESLCDYLYDLLRPQILHEQKLDVLCELATIVNALIAMDGSQYESPDQSEPDSSFRFSVLLRPILQDVQTRLIFRAQAVIQTEVANYHPRPEDLDYPNKLIKDASNKSSGTQSHEFKQRMRKLHLTSSNESSNTALRFRLPPDEVQDTWYPSLRKTLWVLSKLHTYVNDAIFEDFAGEAVGICSQSIVTAANLISTIPSQPTNSHTPQVSVSSRVDNQLFVIRHLLILKEMIRTLDVVQVDRGVDLGPLTDVLKELLSPSAARSLLLRPNDLLKRLTARTIADFGQKTIDSKSELDKRLKTTCQEFINQTARNLGARQIEGFMDRCQGFLKLGGGSVTDRDLPSQEWARSEVVLKLFQTYAQQLQAGIGSILNKMILYLEDEKTVNVIFPPLQEEILDRYQQFYNLIRSEYDSMTIKQIGSTETVKDLIEEVVYQIFDSN